MPTVLLCHQRVECYRERDGRWTAERWAPHGHVSVIRVWLPEQQRDSNHTPVTKHVLQNLSVFLDATCRYAASIDDILEEEEHYADQLKEYLFYTDAVR